MNTVIRLGLRPPPSARIRVTCSTDLGGGVGGLNDCPTAPSSYSRRCRHVREGGRVVAGRRRWAGGHPWGAVQRAGRRGRRWAPARRGPAGTDQSCIRCGRGPLSLIHISEPTRQAEISYAVFCLKKKKK